MAQSPVAAHGHLEHVSLYQSSSMGGGYNLTRFGNPK